MIMGDDLPAHAGNYVPLTPVSFLARTAAVHPDRVAVRYGPISRTYKVFEQRCHLLASALRAKGIQPGDVVSILAPNTPAHLEAHFGVPMAGAILNSINTRLDAETIAFMLLHCQSKMLIVDDELAELALEVCAKMERQIDLVRIADPQATPNTGIHLEYEALLAQGDPNFCPVGPADEWDTIAINYTSGTTGRPKGVVYHHRGAYLNAVGNIMAWGLNGQPTYLWTLPMFHCNGWCFPWTITALAGTHICTRRLDETTIARAFLDEGVTHFCGAPIVLARAADPPESLRNLVPPGIRMMVAGAPPSAAIIAKAEAMGFDVTQTYGLTEVYGPCVVCEWKPEWNGFDAGRRARLKARQGVRYHLQEGLAVCDPETMRVAPADGETIGEIMIRGNIAMKGYLKDPAATNEAFRGGWFHSGDLGVVHPDGYVEVRDRSKDIIISGGENISTIELEGVLLEHPDVAEAAVVAQRDERWGEVPCAFITLRAGASLGAGDIIRFCEGRLARFKIPKAVIFAEIPKTATGKIQKHRLRQLLASGLEPAAFTERSPR